MKLNEYKKKALENPRFKKEYESYDLAFEIGQMVLEARIVKNISQKNLAEKLGTKQPSIARLESGRALPSLSFLEKIAHALDTHLIAPKFAFLEPKSSSQSSLKIISMNIVSTNRDLGIPIPKTNSINFSPNNSLFQYSYQ